MLEQYDLTLYDYFKRNLKICYLTGSHDETNIRCPFCGDSRTDPNDAHLYIHNKPPFKYYCQKCNVSGIVDKNLLNAIDLYDPKVQNYVEDSKHQYLKTINTKYGNNFLNFFKNDIILQPNHIDKLETKKIKYIENRLGITIQDEDIDKYKIILNLEDFFKMNNIKMNNYYKENLNDLNNNYVGFLLNDRNMICFRNINKNPKVRYVNKKIYNESIYQSRKFFSIKNDLDLSSRVININLSEGIFDIIGVFNHIYNCEMASNDLFISCNGKSYNFVLRYLQSLGILNCNINIYSDKDVPRQKFESLKEYNILCKYNGINLYYNEIGKDYGVKKDEIELSSCIYL